MIDFAQIDEEVRAGLRNERERLENSAANLKFYRALFEEFPTRRTSDYYARGEYRRTSRLMGRIVETLCDHLYSAQPTRDAGDPDASTRLAAIYKSQGMPVLWQKADELSTVADVAAFKFSGSPDPDKPVTIKLVEADALVVWEDDDEPTMPAAVGVLDRYDRRRRLTVFTDEWVARYETRKDDLSSADRGNTAFVQTGRVPTPYLAPDGRGFLPFAFAHFEYPTKCFWQPGIGDHLKQINDHLNMRLDDSGDGIRFGTRPIGVASGLSASWTPPRGMSPGDFMSLGTGIIDAAGNGIPPALSYLVPPTGWIQDDWADLNAWLDHVFQTCGVPPGAIRLTSSASASGFSLMVEKMPLMERAQKRRTPFATYETKVAETTFRVAGAWLRANGKSGEPFDGWADSLALELKWPNLWIAAPGPERDRADAWRIDRGLASRVAILMEREEIDRDEAVRRLKQFQADDAETAPPVPETDPTTNPKPTLPPPR